LRPGDVKKFRQKNIMAALLFWPNRPDPAAAYHQILFFVKKGEVPHDVGQGFSEMKTRQEN
jgi:hypothetical protein